MLKSGKPILITGAHRSGSTWVGRIMDSAPKTLYINEPFNLSITNRSSPVRYWFEFIDCEMPIEKQKSVKQYLESFFRVTPQYLLKNFKNIRNWNHFYQLYVDLRVRQEYRPLFKDPLAIFSAEWISDTLNTEVVIIIRHPCAFVASLKAKNWTSDFNHFKSQTELVNTRLANYKDAIHEFSVQPPDIVQQGILLWNMIYAVVKEYQSKHPKHWHFVRHEDLSVEPHAEFKKLFDALELELAEGVLQKITASTTANKSSHLKRNSLDNMKSWKERLSKYEIEIIKSGTAQVAGHFYSSQEW